MGYVYHFLCVASTVTGQFTVNKYGIFYSYRSIYSKQIWYIFEQQLVRLSDLVLVMNNIMICICASALGFLSSHHRVTDYVTKCNFSNFSSILNVMYSTTTLATTLTTVS